MKHPLIPTLCGSLALLATTSFFTLAPVSLSQAASSDAPPSQQCDGKHCKPDKQHKGMPWDRLQEPLGLTDEQVSELRALQAEQRNAMQELWENTSLSPAQKRTQAKELRTAHKEEVTSLLTPAQQNKLKSMRQHWKDKKAEEKGSQE